MVAKLRGTKSAAELEIIRKAVAVSMDAHREAMLAVEREFGGMKPYLASLGEFIPAVAALKKRFKHVGDFGAYYFLYVVGEPVPSHHEFRAKLLESGNK